MASEAAGCETASSHFCHPFFGRGYKHPWCNFSSYYNSADIFQIFSNMCYAVSVLEVVKQRVNAKLEPGSDEGVVWGNFFL